MQLESLLRSKVCSPWIHTYPSTPGRRSPLLGKALFYGNKVWHTSLFKVIDSCQREKMINPTLYSKSECFWSCPQWLGPKGEERVGKYKHDHVGSPSGQLLDGPEEAQEGVIVHSGWGWDWNGLEPRMDRVYARATSAQYGKKKIGKGASHSLGMRERDGRQQL